MCTLDQQNDFTSYHTLKGTAARFRTQQQVHLALQAIKVLNRITCKTQPQVPCGPCLCPSALQAAPTSQQYVQRTAHHAESQQEAPPGAPAHPIPAAATGPAAPAYDSSRVSGPCSVFLGQQAHGDPALPSGSISAAATLTAESAGHTAVNHHKCSAAQAERLLACVGRARHWQDTGERTACCLPHPGVLIKQR